MLTRMTIHLRRRAALGPLAITVFFILGLFPAAQSAPFHESDGKTFIVDQKNERWEITQALGLGFRPEGFQFGIGRNAIRPLDADHLKIGGVKLPGTTRVIGVADAASGSAHAYSVNRLTRHEIANTRLGEIPIAAAY